MATSATIARNKIWAHSLGSPGSGYKSHHWLTQTRPAQAVGPQRTLVGVPRWLLLDREEASYQQEVLGVSGDVKSLRPEEKLAALQRLFSEKAATSGVLFAQQYESFRQSKLGPLLHAAASNNLDNLDLVFSVYGIVQQCGTRAALNNLFNMVKLSAGAKINPVNIKDDPDQVEIKLSGVDLFSAHLFLGLVSPDLDATGRFTASRKFNGVDIGWGLSPHNLVVAASTHNPIELPMGMHMYTLNIERVSGLAISQTGENLEIPTATQEAAVRLQAEVHGFISSF